MSFTKNVLFRPAPIVWSGTTGALGLATFFGMDTQVAMSTRLLFSSSVFLLLLLVGLLIVSHALYQSVRAPVGIRSIVEGTHFYRGNVILILDKSDWVEVGQLLALVSLSDGVQVPLALIQVETSTTEGFPQCVVVVPLTNDPLGDYLYDKTRWKSLNVLSDIKSRYLEIRPNG